MRRLGIVWLVLGLLTLPVRAGETLDRAEAMYDVGAFLNAAHLARTEGSADGHALAARATLAHIEFLALTEEKPRLLAQAETDAKRAMAINPELAEAHLQYVVTLGLTGRAEGTLQAHFNGYASEARDHLDLVLAKEPDNPWALALLGGWHLEIAANGAVGAALYNADADAGVAAYQRAQNLAPENAAIAYQYALQLTALDWRVYKDQALRVIDAYRQIGADPHDAFGQLSALRLEALSAALMRADAGELETFIEQQTSLGSQSTPAQRRHQVRPPIGLPR